MSSFGFSPPGSGLHGQRVSRRENSLRARGRPRATFTGSRIYRNSFSALCGDVCMKRPLFDMKYHRNGPGRHSTRVFARFLYGRIIHRAAFLPTASDPVLTQNPKKADRHGRKQRKIRRADGGKQHKSEPKRLRFCFETTYGPEGRGVNPSRRTKSPRNRLISRTFAFHKLLFSDTAFF